MLRIPTICSLFKYEHCDSFDFDQYYYNNSFNCTICTLCVNKIVYLFYKKTGRGTKCRTKFILYAQEKYKL